MNRATLEQPFPKQQIKYRKGRKGQRWEYIPAEHVVHRLNDAFDGDWSFQVLDHQIHDDEIVILASLTAGAVTKTQFGAKQIAKYTDGAIISYGDAYKAAASDALKKCATLFGVALYLRTPDAEIPGGSPSCNNASSQSANSGTDAPAPNARTGSRPSNARAGEKASPSSTSASDTGTRTPDAPTTTTSPSQPSPAPTSQNDGIRDRLAKMYLAALPIGIRKDSSKREEFNAALTGMSDVTQWPSQTIREAIELLINAKTRSHDRNRPWNSVLSGQLRIYCNITAGPPLAPPPAGDSLF